MVWLNSLPAVIRELREEIRVVQGYLDAANDENQVYTRFTLPHAANVYLLILLPPSFIHKL